MFRTDKHNNPAAFTTDIARQAGLAPGVDYERGDSFVVGPATYYTAKLLKNPVETTTRVIDAIGFYAKSGGQRWAYIGIPKDIWDSLSPAQKSSVVHFMYHHEGGTQLESLWKV